MTIRMLTARPPYKPNDIVTLDAATEAALVSEKVASTDLTGGSAYQAPVPKAYTGVQRAVACSAALIASPTAEMLADGLSEFVLDVPPFTRYRSNGTTLEAISGGLADGTNLFGVQAPVLDVESAISGSNVAAPICTAIETIASDGDGSGNQHQDWAGMMRGLMVRMTDGTLFVCYIQNNAGTDRLRLMRSPTGGPNGGAWSQVATIATDMYKPIVLRDRSRDHVILVTAEGADPNYSIKLRRFDSTGAQVGSTFTVNQPGKGICQMLRNTGFYYEAGIGKDGRVVLAGWTLSLPTTIQPNTTLSCYKQVQWILPNGDGWTAEKPVRFYTGVRADYDNVSVGSDGDPDMVYGIMQGNVAMWEGISTYLPERLAPMRLYPVAAYAFDRFGVWWHNRRTREHGFKWISPSVPWVIRPWDGDGGTYNAANDIPDVRTKQAIMHVATGEWWIPYRIQKPQPYAAGFTCTASIAGNVVTVSAVTGSPILIGTTFTAHTLAPQGFLEAKVLAQTGGTAGQAGTYIVDVHQTLASGTLSGCNPSFPSTSQAPVTQHRVMIVSPKGEIRWDGEITNGVGYGMVSLAQNAQGRVWAVFVARSEPTNGANQTQFHMWELVQDSDGGLPQTTLSAANCYNGNNAPVAGNVGFGTWATYLGIPQTLPARSSNQGAILCDLHHGSRPTVNRIEVLISRRATDHNGSGTATSTNDSTQHKMDVMSFSVPT